MPKNTSNQRFGIDKQMDDGSQTSDRLRGRSSRRWGWVFIISFLAQAVFFGLAIADTIKSVNVARDIRRDFQKNDPNSTMVIITSRQIDKVNRELYALIAAMVIISSGAIVAAVFCFMYGKKGRSST